jgi:hypothetical protein
MPVGGGGSIHLSDSAKNYCIPKQGGERFLNIDLCAA